MSNTSAAPKAQEKRAAPARAAAASVSDGHEPPNKILFVQNLPDATTDQMLKMLFEQCVFCLCVRAANPLSGLRAMLRFAWFPENPVSLSWSMQARHSLLRRSWGCKVSRFVVAAALLNHSDVCLDHG